MNLALSSVSFLASQENSTIRSKGRSESRSLSNIGEQIKDALILFLTPSLAEDVPESQRLIASSGDDRLAVWTQGEIKHAV